PITAPAKPPTTAPIGPPSTAPRAAPPTPPEVAPMVALVSASVVTWVWAKAGAPSAITATEARSSFFIAVSPVLGRVSRPPELRVKAQARDGLWRGEPPRPKQRPGRASVPAM